MLKNKSSSNNNVNSKYLRIKNKLKLQKYIVLQLSKDLNNFQIVEKKLTIQVQVLESQKERRKEIIKQNIKMIVTIIITTTITLKLMDSLTFFTFTTTPLLAFLINKKILNKENNVKLPNNIEEDLANTNLALQYIKKMVNKLNEVIERERQRIKEIENNKYNEKALQNETIVDENNNYDKILEKVQKEICDNAFEEMISEYDINQNLALSLTLNYKNDNYKTND